MAELTLPPVLYWSPSLARHLNRTAGPDAQHGLIDATVATMLMSWSADTGGWAILRDLPGDAVRLVAEAPAAEVTTEWAVRWPDGTLRPYPTESAARDMAAYLEYTAVSREVRTGPWVPALGVES